MAELNWDDAQWQKVNEAAAEAFNKASVAGAFLPMYGPLAGSAEVVRNERLQLQVQEDITSTQLTVTLDKDHASVNLKLVNMTVNVELSSEQVADETMSNALLAFRRAANILALEQDRVVFAGYLRGFVSENSKIIVNTVSPQKGLADLFARRDFATLKSYSGRQRWSAGRNRGGERDDHSRGSLEPCSLRMRAWQYPL